MINNNSSIISKGWLIIGVVLVLTGTCLLFLANSLFYESNQLDSYINGDIFNGNIKQIQNHFETNGRFLIISSL